MGLKDDCMEVLKEVIPSDLHGSASRDLDEIPEDPSVMIEAVRQMIENFEGSTVAEGKIRELKKKYISS